MSSKCTIISIGKINKYILLVFSAALFRISLIVLQEPMNFDLPSNSKIINWNGIIFILFYSIGLSLSISLFY